MDIEQDPIIRGFKIARNFPYGKYRLGEIFRGLEASPAISGLGESEQGAYDLRDLDVEITDDVKYMRVSDVDGRLLIGPKYLRRGRKEFIYLDLIHELTHIRQFRQGHDIYNPKYSYIERPTELEAFANAVVEARRIGLSDVEIYEYLRVDWISESELEELAKKLGVTSAQKK